jgi:hypothetical protein
VSELLGLVVAQVVMGRSMNVCRRNGRVM